MDQIKENEENSLILDCRINLEYYRQYWFDSFRESLPNTLIFWGSAFVLSLMGVYFFRDSVREYVIFIFASVIFFVVPTLMTFFSYETFMRTVKKGISSMTETEKHYNFIFKRDSDGFECISGKDFSFIAWDSIKDVNEKDKYFVFNRKIQPFFVPKDIFRTENDLNYFRNLLNSNLRGKLIY